MRTTIADPAGLSWRRGWDSNPRTPVKMLLEFQSSAFDRSATSPIKYLRLSPAAAPEGRNRRPRGGANDKAWRRGPHPQRRGRSGLRGGRLGDLVRGGL